MSMHAVREFYFSGPYYIKEKCWMSKEQSLAGQLYNMVRSRLLHIIVSLGSRYCREPVNLKLLDVKAFR